MPSGSGNLAYVGAGGQAPAHEGAGQVVVVGVDEVPPLGAVHLVEEIGVAGGVEGGPGALQGGCSVIV